MRIAVSYLENYTLPTLIYDEELYENSYNGFHNIMSVTSSNIDTYQRSIVNPHWSIGQILSRIAYLLLVRLYIVLIDKQLASFLQIACPQNHTEQTIHDWIMLQHILS